MEQFDQTNFPDIPGIGDTTKATIISEVGDIEKREQSIKKNILQFSDKSDKVDREIQKEIPRANSKRKKSQSKR